MSACLVEPWPHHIMVRLYFVFSENSGYHLEHLTSTFSQAYFGLIEVVGMLPGGKKIDPFSLGERWMRVAERPHRLSACRDHCLGLGAGYLIILLLIFTSEAFKWVSHIKWLGAEWERSGTRESGKSVCEMLTPL